MSSLGSSTFLFLSIVASISGVSVVKNDSQQTSIAIHADGIQQAPSKESESDIDGHLHEDKANSLTRKMIDSEDDEFISNLHARNAEVKATLDDEDEGFFAEFKMREPRSSNEDTLIRSEAKAALLDALVADERRETVDEQTETVDDELDATLQKKYTRTPDGCRVGKEEFYGGKCYKKCSKFQFDSVATGNAGFDRRTGANSCSKEDCNQATEDFFGGRCYKACADLIASYPIRKSFNKCGKAGGGVKKSDSYNVGFGTNSKPIVVQDIAGQDCSGTVECCKGYNSNDDDEQQTQCPYVPTQIGNCVEKLTGRKDNGYRGCQTRTRSGRTCQKWTAQSPHKHSNTPSQKWGKGLGNMNKCRNPDGEPTIWCYTQDRRKRWEFCNPL